MNPNPSPQTTPSMTSLALRVHNMPQMLTFYSAAFGVQFREVNTGGLLSHFGECAGITLKLVPIRDESDFEGFPVHQPGFTVADVEDVISLAVKYGGKQEGPMIQTSEGRRVAVRDPDGNTIELADDKVISS